MKIPNFSESQLQQLINTEITMHLFSKEGKMHHPNIVSLIQEKRLGWDTAFYFPWLMAPPNPKHKGCNFFIQYKLSSLIEGHRAEEWINWKKPYLRFKIPYPTKDKITNSSFDDYHQFDCLKELADQGYHVYYTTNHILYDYELFNLATNQKLLDEIPFLDVSKIGGYHKMVTFAEKHSYFLLHSEILKVDIIRWDILHKSLQEEKKTSFNEDIKFLENLITKFEEKILGQRQGGFREEVRKHENIIIKGLIISKYLRRYFDVFWFKY